MTEAEAKAKWCPFVKMRTLLDLSVRNGHAPLADDTDCNCIASGCMAWRVRHQWRWTATEPGHWHEGNIAPNDTQEVRQHGFCGLAGAQ